MKVVIPKLHLNGSGADNLLLGYSRSISAVHEAIEMVRGTAPHMRDYYHLPNGDETFRAALDEHARRVTALEQVAKELETMAAGVVDQMIK